MSDFLTRMAQYSRGEREVVTPVLAGLFGQQAEPEAVEAVVDVSSLQGNSAQPDTERAMSAVAAERGILQQPARQKRVEPEQSIVAEPVFPQPERKRGGDVQPTLSPESPIAAAPGADLHDPVHSHRAVPKPLQPATVGRTMSLAEKAFQAVSATGNSDASLVADVRLVNEQLAVTAEPAPLLIPPQRGTSLHGDTQSVSPNDMIGLTPLAGQGVPKEPAIHITIGRIDVRAQTPAPVSVAHRSRPTSESSLSLSMYLKRGGGGS